MYLGFPGWAVVKAVRFHCRGMGLIPGQGSSFRMPRGAAKKKKREKIKDVSQVTLSLLLLF